MLAVARRAGWVALLLTTAALIASPGYANPLGLSVGDEITSIEWDALEGNSEGGFYNVSTNLLDIDGTVNSVTIAGPSTLVQSNVSFAASLNFISESVNVNLPFIGMDSIYRSPGFNPDVVMQENGVNILLGSFTSDVLVSGTVNILANVAVFTGIGRITVDGGDPDLVEALGGAGTGQANILLTMSVFDFVPGAQNLVLDNVLHNSNYMVSISGTLIPLSSSPFVPEPSTALLLGGGLVGLLAVSRRARARRN